jgi:hypothetical protein
MAHEVTVCDNFGHVGLGTETPLIKKLMAPYQIETIVVRQCRMPGSYGSSFIMVMYKRKCLKHPNIASKAEAQVEAFVGG